MNRTLGKQRRLRQATTARGTFAVLKAEFPVAVSEVTEVAVWHEACRELTAACNVPWVLLSAGVSYELFLRQATVSCEAGASGVMAGRAVWNEALNHDRNARRDWLATVGRERMQRLTALVEALGRQAIT